jgi:hypothetical protein
MNTTISTEKRIAKDPQEWIDAVNAKTWAGVKVTLISIDSETPKGLKRFTIRLETEDR